MYRTLTAAVALAAGLGMAGLAHAQTNTNTAAPSSPMTTAPSASQPGMSGTQNPQTMSAPGQTSTYGASPQANMSQMNQGAQQQASQSEIQQAQQQLKSQGLYRGAADGVMGPETQIALRAFQRQNGLPQTAQLDQQTSDRLSGSGNGQSTTRTQGMTPSSSTGMQNPAGSTGTTNTNSSLNGR
jgi:peptidoglycan hydrolase-like protein with peptidoglycan-binding domain